MQDPIGEFIAIFNQVAYHGTGHSILSSTRIVTFGHKLMIELFALEAANVSRALTVISYHLTS